LNGSAENSRKLQGKTNSRGVFQGALRRFSGHSSAFESFSKDALFYFLKIDIFAFVGEVGFGLLGIAFNGNLSVAAARTLLIANLFLHARLHVFDGFFHQQGQQILRNQLKAVVDYEDDEKCTDKIHF